MEKMENIEQEMMRRLEEQGRKLEEVLDSVNRLKNYFRWTLIISILVIILPLIGIALIIPQILSAVSTSGF
ncbi:MAG: hypothetical protein AAB846_01475 [Patescibacteria group bacterium]